jgi:shikimate dehydrogenase
MKKFAVLGSPISHSLSPLLHTTAYEALGFQGSYEKIEIKTGGLKAFLETLDSSWHGLSLTMPLKEEVIAQVSEISELALRVQSANTLFRKNHEWAATTTDVSGFAQSLNQHGIQANGHVLIIGAGATARAAAAACDGTASEITVLNRSTARVPDMSRAVLRSTLNFIDWDSQQIFDHIDLVISTTPSGASDVLVEQFPITTKVAYFESLYNPWPTKALKEWEKRGGLAIDGLDLLIHQGIEQIAIFTQLEFNKAEMYSLLRKVGIKALS